MEEKVVDLEFSLQGHSSRQEFRVMRLGKFQGILGMDWLRSHDADIQCGKGTISFETNSREMT